MTANPLSQVPRELAERLLRSHQLNRQDRKDWPETYELAEAVIREAMQKALEEAERVLGEVIVPVDDKDESIIRYAAIRKCAEAIRSLKASSLTEQETIK